MKNSSEEVAHLKASRTSYKNWMQTIYDDIKDLKLYELALPCAHNAGMDSVAVDRLSANWIACQDHRFITQLNLGARVLDLRIAHTNKPSNIVFLPPLIALPLPISFDFRETIRCIHGLPGRYLSECVSDVLAFAEANPGEIIILDVHSYDPGSDPASAIERCRATFKPLQHLLLPTAAQEMRLEEIRQNYPGRNVIICWSKGGYWPTIEHKWSGSDLTSEDDLIRYIKKARYQLPNNRFSSLSATAYSVLGGPTRLNPKSAVWAEVFRANEPAFNIINADFIQDTGIVERCIELNKKTNLPDR